MYLPWGVVCIAQKPHPVHDVLPERGDVLFEIGVGGV